MPGLSKLSDKDFIRAFQVTDGIIQNNQPLFMLTWLGSIISILCLILSSIISVGLHESWLVLFISVSYLLGVQGITILVHLPLNKNIQKLVVDETKIQSFNEQRVYFENRWVTFNFLRTFVAICVSVSLLLIATLQ